MRERGAMKVGREREGLSPSPSFLFLSLLSLTVSVPFFSSSLTPTIFPASLFLPHPFTLSLALSVPSSLVLLFTFHHFTCTLHPSTSFSSFPAPSITSAAPSTFLFVQNIPWINSLVLQPNTHIGFLSYVYLDLDSGQLLSLLTCLIKVNPTKMF